MRRPLEAADAKGGPEATLEVDRFKRGNIIHRLLQLLPTVPEDRRAALAEQFLRNPSHGLAAAEITAWRDEVLAVLDHPDYVELFSARGRAEVPLCGLVRGQMGDDTSQQVISGQIDRLLVSDSRIIAVDYKSNRPPPADVAAVPRLYLRQMAAYRALLRQIYPGKTIHCGLLWTDGPNLMLLPEDLLDANMP